MHRPYWPPLDEPPCASFDCARRLKEAGYPQDLARLGYAPDEDGVQWACPRVPNDLAAPSAGELLRWYFEVSAGDGLEPVTVFCRRSDYMALSASKDRRAATLDDAVAEVVLAHLGDTRCSRV